MEKTCANAIDRSVLDPKVLPRHTVAEISRLAVIARYRNRHGESASPAPLNEEAFGTSERPRFPYLTVGLYLATIELARLHGIAVLLVLTEPRLANHFRKLGVEIIQIGASVEHRGTRIPSFMTVQAVIDGLNFLVRPLYSTIAKEVQAGVRLQSRQTNRPGQPFTPYS